MPERCPQSTVEHVPVGKKYPFIEKRDGCLFIVYCETEIPEEFSDHDLMITEYIVNLDPVFYIIVEEGKRFEVIFRKDNIILEPELEEIAEYEKTGNVVTLFAQEFHEQPCAVTRFRSDMGVAEEYVHR